jgi:putative phosphotransacetylase
MNNQEIQAIVAKVLDQLSKPAETGGGQIVRAGIPVEVSARHVHLNAQAIETLFGTGATLAKKRELSQTGEFLSEQRVRLVTPKGEIPNVAVLGPTRDSIQVELSITDAKSLGLKPPVNLSGNLKGACDVYIVGEKGMLLAAGSVIIARAHIHMTPKDARDYGVADGEIVHVQVKGERQVTFDEVLVRVSESFVKAMHIDYDEANACGINKDATGIILK